MTECTPAEIRTKAPGRRDFVARFDGGDITTDGGVLLFQAVEEKRSILKRFAECFTDHRDPSRVEHTVTQLVSQRVLAIALGYEDVNDHDRLRLDPLLASVVGKIDPKGSSRKRQADTGLALASPATLHRLELSHPGIAADDRYNRIGLNQEAVDHLLVDLFLEAYEEAPEEIVIDLDATDDRVHGNQVGRFFHGYYDQYCFLPLYIFVDGHLLCARLRTADRDGASGSIGELDCIIKRIRSSWPDTRIIVRGDSGFCRDWLMSWCEDQIGVEFVLGLAKNDRLVSRIAKDLDEVHTLSVGSGKPVRRFKELNYRTRSSWSQSRRVVAKVEHIPGRSNPRFVVTSLSSKSIDARELYEDLYCARGDMENRIKEQQLDLFADRTSCHLFRANQVRLYLSSLAYVMMSELRRIGLTGTELAQAQCGTIRTRLLKIGARVRVTARNIWVSMSESYPLQDLLMQAWHRVAYG